MGDDYGVPTDLPWATVFKVGLPPTTADNLLYSFGVETPPELIGEGGWVAVHPTQLYETAAGFLIWGITLVLLVRGVRPGNLFLTTVALLAVERFWVEFLRAKDDRFFGQFTLAQLISLALVVIMGALYWRGRSQAVASGAIRGAT